MHAAINEELRAHVEDKAEMYQDFGIEQSLAYEKAVRDMGDTSALGIQMNEAHHLRIAKPLLGLILILTVIGVIRELMDFSFFNTFDSIYYLWGMLGWTAFHIRNFNSKSVLFSWKFRFPVWNFWKSSLCV